MICIALSYLHVTYSSIFTLIIRYRLDGKIKILLTIVTFLFHKNIATTVLFLSCLRHIKYVELYHGRLLLFPFPFLTSASLEMFPQFIKNNPSKRKLNHHCWIESLSYDNTHYRARQTSRHQRDHVTHKNNELSVTPVVLVQLMLTVKGFLISIDCWQRFGRRCHNYKPARQNLVFRNRIVSTQWPWHTTLVLDLWYTCGHIGTFYTVLNRQEQTWSMLDTG